MRLFLILLLLLNASCISAGPLQKRTRGIFPNLAEFAPAKLLSKPQQHLAKSVPASENALDSTMFAHDAIGSVIGRIGPSSSSTTRYDVFGGIRSTSGASASFTGEIGFTAHTNDPETGLVYAKARYMEPEWGIFLSEDPERGSVGDVFSSQGFIYANSNPTRFTDPTGRRPDLATANIESSTMCNGGRCSDSLHAEMVAAHQNATAPAGYMVGAITVGANAVLAAPTFFGTVGEGAAQAIEGAAANTVAVANNFATGARAAYAAYRGGSGFFNAINTGIAGAGGIAGSGIAAESAADIIQGVDALAKGDIAGAGANLVDLATGPSPLGDLATARRMTRGRVTGDPGVIRRKASDARGKMNQGRRQRKRNTLAESAEGELEAAKALRSVGIDVHFNKESTVPKVKTADFRIRGNQQADVFTPKSRNSLEKTMSDKSREQSRSLIINLRNLPGVGQSDVLGVARKINQRRINDPKNVSPTIQQVIVTRGEDYLGSYSP